MMPTSESTLFCSPTGSNAMRGSDSFGQGRFAGPRGLRLHNGVDFNVEAGGDVYSPIFGKIVRVAVPYKSDDRFRELVIEGVGRYAGYSAKLFILIR
ncbi:hypothetical protein [Limnobacter parvus]|uniref:Uncharacterized protein n=1 Tax=Limnobacter parvus TaxID=2939690 RepID=A0ABT1XGV2_9BURK|nr:hypothetical protein [Limnobacter parvus]MCR2746495.1 hypothetical protein [Limnobacter parvus]